jgi:acetolactate synthase-1/2/3 large subunit
MAFYDALYHEPSITHIMTRDERSASFMADVYARVSGRVGVCEGPSGGGATYIVPGVAEAHGSAIPLLCLTSDTPVGEDHRGVLTELDQVGLFRPITKWSERVNLASGIEDAVHRAVRLATSDRPGAVHLSLPSDVLEDEGGTATRCPISSYDVAPRTRQRADSGEVQKAADLIARAKRPVIVAGGGVLASRACDELTRLAESTGIPVGTSINGKGSIAETSECSIGVVGGNGARSYANQWVREADLVFFIGIRTGSTTTAGWTLPDRSNAPASVHLDVSSKEIGNTYPASATLQGDAKVTLEDVLAAIETPARMKTAAKGRLARLDEQKRTYFNKIALDARSDAQPIKPQRLVATMRDLLDDETIIVADPGTPTPYLSAQYQVRSHHGESPRARWPRIRHSGSCRRPCSGAWETHHRHAGRRIVRHVRW